MSPERALAYLRELSPQLRSAAILDDERRPRAGVPPPPAEKLEGGALLELRAGVLAVTAVAPAGIPLELAEHDLRLALSEALLPSGP